MNSQNSIEFFADTKSDAQRVFKNADQVIQYLEQNGLNESDAIWDYSNPNRVRVEIPFWKKDIERYNEAKARQCELHGCE